MTVSISGTSGVTFNDSSVQDTAATGFGFKNRIINGAMVIDQRNAGASVTINSTAATYTLDRFMGFGQATDGVFTIQQDASAPEGFKNSLKVTVTTADASIGASQVYAFGQVLEGFNVSDFDFGTASAKPVTVSFWVRSSLTGTFGGVLKNDATYSYPFTYAISAANTWEYKTVTIAGQTAGTWATNSSAGMRLFWTLGAGSSLTATANTWAASQQFKPTGAVDVIATSGATFYITGVQLEKGSTATSFDYRPYGTELVLCQRYGLFVPRGAFGRAGSATQIIFFTSFNMRSAPTASLLSGSVVADNGSASATATSPTNDGISASDNGVRLFIGGFSGLTTGTVFPVNSGDKMFLSAEL
jgi:hypothetical protein